MGNYTPGLNFPASTFMDGFLSDPFIATNTDPRMTLTVPPIPINNTFNRKPQFFTICGQSGIFATIIRHHPMNRVGEPVVVHVMNAGLWTHSMHMHAITFLSPISTPGPGKSSVGDTFTSKPWIFMTW